MTGFVFSTQNADGTSNLFSTDGTTAGTVKLNSTGPAFARFVPDFTNFNGELYFLGTPNVQGPAAPQPFVYKTNGTAGGTIPLVLQPGTTEPNALAVINGKLLASGPSLGSPGGIWSSLDGTNFTEIATGTTIAPGSFVVSNGVGYFAGLDLSIGNQAYSLWRTDGTVAGTLSITPPGVTLDPHAFTPVAGGKTVFVNVGANGNGALWVTNGTAAGTLQIAVPLLGAQISPSMASTNGKAVFSAIDASGNPVVWATDGTVAGTVEILNSGVAGTIRGFQAFNGKVIFNNGSDTVITNGTATGTFALGTGAPLSSLVIGSRLFTHSSGAGGTPILSVTNGTPTGVVALTVPGLTSINGPLTAVGGSVVFEGTDSLGQQALFETDGTVAGSRELALPAGVTVNASTRIAADLSAGTVSLAGGAQFYAAAAGTVVQAGSGSDTVAASAGKVTVLGGSGQLSFYGGTGSSSATGGAGSATLFGGSGGGVFTGGAAGPNILISQGASGANTTLTGAAAGDRIFGSAQGNDVLKMGAGRESVLGGGGVTAIHAGSAAGVIFTGAGTTSVTGGIATGDTIVGGSGVLSVFAQNGDAIFGNTGALFVTGSTAGADSIVGGSGALTVAGKGGNMLVVAGTSVSTIGTGNGASLIFAGSGTTLINGGSGSMQVVLGSGKTTVNEGSGPTAYDVVKGAAGGVDVIAGFKPGTDSIQLFGYKASEQSVSTGAGSTVLSLGDGTKITLLGVTNTGHSIVG